MPPHSTVKSYRSKSPCVAERVPVSHVKLKSTQTNIIEPLLEHERSMMSWLTPIRVHISSHGFLGGFCFFFSPPSIIPCLRTVQSLFQCAEVAWRVQRLVFLAMLAAWLYRGRLSITFLSQSEISQQLQDGLRLHLIQTLMSCFTNRSTQTLVYD